jgi:hypothetical protein
MYMTDIDRLYSLVTPLPISQNELLALVTNWASATNQTVEQAVAYCINRILWSGNGLPFKIPREYGGVKIEL